MVYDPFNGIGSTVYQAILQDRIGWGTELNPEYWRYSIGYAESAQIKAASPTLFDIAKEMEAMK